MTEHPQRHDRDTQDAFVDPRRSGRFDDVGGPGLIAAVVITAGGEECLVLAVDDQLDGPDPFTPSDWRNQAPHELTGRLPRDFAPKCGRRASTSNRPCRNVVAHYGEACARHQSLADRETVHSAEEVRR